MPEPREPRSIIEAAEQSAAAGDYASAEKLLREAAVLQEASLGSLDPDLANTLNNLGIVCEINNNPIDAEDCFRRAVAIATTVLEPDHPFVATSRKNLRDFCDARGKPVDVQPPVRRRFVRPLAIGALGPGLMVIVILTAVRPWLTSSEQANSPSATVTDAPRQATTRPEPPSSVQPATLPQETTATTAVVPDAKRARRVTEASTSAGLTVVKARLCAEIDDFACDPPDRPIPSGPLFFYTQVKSTTATTIQHRWYRDNRLYQSVPLRVQASPGGYRTFSESIMTGDSAGSWRVELRTEDGVLLHEERFAVR